MAIAKIVTGDDLALPVTLKLNGATFNMLGAIVHARLVSTDHESVYTAEVQQAFSATGADWANSLVIIEMATGDTAGITYQGKAKLEIQVADPAGGAFVGKKTWFTQVEIIRGNIA